MKRFVINFKNRAVRKKLRRFFEFRDLFYKKKKPSSGGYPYEVIDPLVIFKDTSEEYISYCRYHLVGDNWLSSDTSHKPVALLWGFNDWKYGFVADYLREYRVAFVPRKSMGPISAYRVGRMPSKPKVMVVWGYTDSIFVRFLSKIKKMPIHRLEDGFIRSAELGAKHSTPYSLVLDKSGMYFNGRRGSDLEQILNSYNFTGDEALLRCAQEAIDLTTRLSIVKYNIPGFQKGRLSDSIKIKPRIAVLGQVQSDASIKYGNPDKWSIEDVIKLARYENPEAEVFYRPHPEIYRGFQKDGFRAKRIKSLAEIVSPEEPLPEFLESLDQVYTITSLSGMEALVRGVKVTVVGVPFYAGWGLTDDRAVIKRRKRKLSLVELFAGVYLKYPRYLANLEDSNIGLQAACHKIVADREVEADSQHKEMISNKKWGKLLESDYWIKAFFSGRPLVEYAYENLNLIRFELFLNKQAGEEFQLIYLYLICGRLESTDRISYFLKVIRSRVSGEVLNRLLLDLSIYKPGSYITIHLSWLIEEDGLYQESKELIQNRVAVVSDYYEAVRVASKDDIENETHIDRLKAAEKRYADPVRVVNEAAGLVYRGFKTNIEQKRYDLALQDGLKLLLNNYKSRETLHDLLYVLSESFKYSSLISLIELSVKINILANNRNPISYALNSYHFKTEKSEHCDYLFKLYALEVKLNPERFNKCFHVAKEYSETSLLRSVFEGMLRLDNNQTFQKAIGFLEVSKIGEAVKILERLLDQRTDTASIRMAYSRALAAQGEFDRAISIAQSICVKSPSEGAYSHLLRLLKFVGDFPAAKRAYEESVNNGFKLSNEMIIPIYQGLGEVGKAYSLYKDIPSRDLLVVSFPDKYITQSLGGISGSILLVADYGPGDEIRFASLYQEIVDKFSNVSIEIICDFRLYNLFKRSFPNLTFLPVSRTSNFGPDYNSSDFKEIPSASLSRMLDNRAVQRINEVDGIILVPELISNFRTCYSDFPRNPFLSTSDSYKNRYKKYLASHEGNLLVGICWRSHLTNDIRNANYLKVEQLGPLLAISGVTYINLQYDESSSEVAWCNENYPSSMIDIEELDQMKNLDGLAGLVSCLDVVISPSSVLAELSGALGKKTYLISNHGELLWREPFDSEGDIWQRSIRHVAGRYIGDKVGLVENLRSKIQEDLLARS